MAHSVIFVHGTFTNGNKFKSDASLLFHQIQQKFPKANIEWFSWSGKNNFEARNHAADKLSKFIAKLLEDCPKQKISIISHSHGGNVALMATNLIDQSLRKKLHIVCISTPFLGVWYRNANNDKIFLQDMSAIFSEEHPLFILTPKGDEPLFMLKKILSLEAIGTKISNLLTRVSNLHSEVLEQKEVKKYIGRQIFIGVLILLIFSNSMSLIASLTVPIGMFVLFIALGLLGKIAYSFFSQVKSIGFWGQSFFDNFRQTVVVSALPFLKTGERLYKPNPYHFRTVRFSSYKLNRKAKSLRHSEVYQNPKVITDIVDWIFVDFHHPR